MTTTGKAFIAGAYEHPIRKADGKTLAELHADVAIGALRDAGLTTADVDGYFCDTEAPGLGPLSMAEYIGLERLRYMDNTDPGGSAYLLHVGHAAEAIAAGKCDERAAALAKGSGGAGRGGTAAGDDLWAEAQELRPAGVAPATWAGLFEYVAAKAAHVLGAEALMPFAKDLLDPTRFEGLERERPAR